jgi:predicted nucleotidyltransferase component of viral defense system
LHKEGIVNRLVVRTQETQIKIEVTPVMRGGVFEPRTMQVSRTVSDAFGYAETQVVSFNDLYAGKLVAALDRQHPRDLFDVRDLLANEGVTEPLRQAFLAYIVSPIDWRSRCLHQTDAISVQISRKISGA